MLANLVFRGAREFGARKIRAWKLLAIAVVVNLVLGIPVLLVCSVSVTSVSFPWSVEPARARGPC